MSQSESHAEAKWGMVIDMDRCTACQACVTACSMENNIQAVGEDEAAFGRAMHWIRVQRLWDENAPVPTPEHQVMLCQHCGHAPCEPVCPVFASAHSETEQINLQVYTRCIGTRYCANNCPYHVRQFNYFDYQMPEPLNYYFNPDVSVRRRGIMEKCTFCVQRIQKAQIEATSTGEAIQDGDVVPACAQACPTDAIVFGNLRDPESRVSRLARNQRRYRVLEDLGTDPRVVYLKGEKGHGS
jgi:molybdopterin-containing oxidoreductase family iron-sulfur binding subunit